MRGRLLLLIGLIVLLAVIAVVVILPSIGGYVPFRPSINVSSNPANSATYDKSVLVFPKGTVDWKTVGNSNTNNTSVFYCRIAGEWHRCYPIEVARND